MHYAIRPIMYYVCSKLRTRQLRMPIFMEKYFPQYINSLEKTMQFFVLYLFKEAGCK